MLSFSRKRNEAGGRLGAFTLIELIVVIGMIGIMMGVAATGLGSAKNQARITKANVEIRELVNAWLSFDAADEEPVISSGDEYDATEGNLADLLGKGNTTIVYLNSPMVNGAFRDPWGTPYKFRWLQSDTGNTSDKFSASVTFPNRNRFNR
jgi:type II secretory pathway pseudopilin PulG